MSQTTLVSLDLFENRRLHMARVRCSVEVDPKQDDVYVGVMQYEVDGMDLDTERTVDCEVGDTMYRAVNTIKRLEWIQNVGTAVLSADTIKLAKYKLTCDVVKPMKPKEKKVRCLLFLCL